MYPVRIVTAKRYGAVSHACLFFVTHATIVKTMDTAIPKIQLINNTIYIFISF
jgi:hypothetical protein